MELNNLPDCAYEIAKIVKGELKGENRIIGTIVTNTMDNDIANSCFVAINSGKKYIKDAIKKGAKIIITDEKTEESVPVIYVEDVIKALGLLGKYNKRKTKIIGVTGSVGKTTTKEMLASVLSRKFNICFTKSNNNNELGVALTLMKIKDEDYCVVEMGMRHKGDIQYLASLCEPDISVITCCGSSHLEFFNDKSEIIKEKSEIVKYTNELSVLPNEENFHILKSKAKRTLYVGNGGDCYAKNVSVNRQIKFDAVYENRVIRDVVIDSIYEHNITNALNVIAIAKHLQIDNELIRAGLIDYKKELLREQRYIINGAEIIADCYNASFESMKGAIMSVADYSKKQRKSIVLVLGDMLELGDMAALFHREIGALAKKCGAENIYLYGQYSEEYIKGYGKGYKYTDLDSLSDDLRRELDGNKVVLVKASRAMNFEKIVENLRK